MKYIVYDDSGQILRTGMCSPDTLLLQAEEGECVIEGTADDVTQRVVDGEVINK